LTVIAVVAMRGGGGHKAVAPPLTPLRAEALRPALIKTKATPAVHAAKASSGSLTAKEWQAKFWAADKANDYLRFVKEALPAARAGDGRAAWYIGNALSACSYVKYKYHDSADPEAQLQQELTVGTPGEPRARNLPQWVLDQQEHETRRCLGLAKEDPFAGLPPPPGGFVCTSLGVRNPPCNYSSSGYWWAQALADGDPLAQENAASDAAAAISVDPQMPDDVKAGKLKVIQENLRAAVESGDPDALYRAGLLVGNNPNLTTDNMRGFAVSLAACDLGRDCSADNPDNLWSKCILTGACPPNADYAYFLQQSLGPERYGQLYAVSQQVVQSSRAGDWQGVLAYLTIDKHP
jgi:hypothetical protein